MRTDTFIIISVTMLWIRLAVFAVVVPGTTLVFIPLQILRSGWGGRIALGALAYAGWIPLVAGVLLMLWCWYDFAMRGRGTPAPYDPPRQLVVSGPFHVVRNPMYVSGVWMLLGEALITGAPALALYAVVFWAFTATFVVLYEQPTLRRKFGEAYVEYCARVPAWLPRRTQA
jgi:protein-S-isoprenylcysteine O-methyltransferase Ste14